MKRIVRVSIILLLAFSSGFGCQAIKKLSTKPSEGLVHQSYAVRFSGYKQTVMVKTSPEELVAFLGDFRNWFQVSGAEAPAIMEESQGAISVGTSFPFNFKKMGIEISGRMIVAKTTAGELWVIWDNSRMMQVQRWKFEQAGQGTLLTINMATESQETALTQIMEVTGIAEEVCKQVDFMLAGIQAHFDPSLKPEELVAGGLRGEPYETFWNSYSVSAWIAAPPAEAIKRGLNPDTFQKILETDTVKGLAECLYQPENKRQWEKEATGEPIFCPIVFKLAGLEFKVDSFAIIRLGDLQNFYTMHGAPEGLIFSRLKLTGQPEREGTRIQMTLLVEPPGPAYPGLMDALVALGGLPQWMEQILLKIKQSVESAG